MIGIVVRGDRPWKFRRTSHLNINECATHIFGTRAHDGSIDNWYILTPCDNNRHRWVWRSIIYPRKPILNLDKQATYDSQKQAVEAALSLISNRIESYTDIYEFSGAQAFYEIMKGADRSTSDAEHERLGIYTGPISLDGTITLQLK